MRLFKKREQNKLSINKLTIEEKFKLISEEVMSTGINIKKTKKERNELFEILNVSPSQVIILSIFVTSTGYSIYEEKLYEILKEYNRIKLSEDILALKKRFWVGANSDLLAKVPLVLLDDFKEILTTNKVPEPIKEEGLSDLDLFITMSKYFDILEKPRGRFMTPSYCYEIISRLFEKNKTLNFSRGFKKLEETHKWLELEHKLIILWHCCDLVIYWESGLTSADIQRVYTNPEKKKISWVEFRYGQHPLIRFGIFEEVGSNFSGKGIFQLKTKYRDLLLGGLNVRKSSPSFLIKPESIQEKELFFDSEFMVKIEDLIDFFSPDRYREIRERLKKSGYKTGFTCLFYGEPGTGKTETVYQIAKKSGREIFPVDMSKIRNKWVGDSEKNLKSYFDKYKLLVEKSTEENLEPILFFNEADAIIGNRFENVNDSVDKMENTLQNILLQEMEDFDGILIATTNLQGNLDKAFDRRFLYKLNFPNPSVDIRAKIWMSKLDNLSQEDALSLSKKYDFSGGQIDNIGRRYLIDCILHKKSNMLFEDLDSLCSTERIETKIKIGF